MPRRKRRDFPGAWWHVMNRGVAKRTIFETRNDYRYFLSLLARAVRRGEIEVHAFCLMQTHFHLLLRSPKGELSLAMQRIQDMYARRFNRLRERDGPLFRGRFRGKHIHDVAYRRAVFYYIHDNPVAAGLCPSASEHPYSSLWHYARAAGCPWLSTQFGTRMLAESARPTPCSELLARWIKDPRSHVRAVERLVRSAPPHIARWLKTRARLADGVTRPCTVVLQATLRAALHDRRLQERATLRVRISPRRYCGWGHMEAGLLRSACGLSLQNISTCMECTVSMVHTRLRGHRTALLNDAKYARVAAEILSEALRKDYPPT